MKTLTEEQLIALIEKIGEKLTADWYIYRDCTSERIIFAQEEKDSERSNDGRV